MSQSIDIYSRAVVATPEASILPQSLVEAAVSIATQFGVVLLVLAVVVSLVLAGKAASLAPLGTKQLAGGTVFFTLLGIVFVAAYATVQLRDLALAYVEVGGAL
ncbi:MAG: hypothetical protein ACTJGT_00415 [Microbacteriaceae bacterium]